MTLNLTNPWDTIEPNSERLIETNNDKYEFYWGIEKNGDYAFYIPIFSQDNLPQTNINIKNLDINIFESSTPNKYVWVIILKVKEQWSIFKKLCEDLCSVSETATNEKALIIQVQHRLKRWQDLLSRKFDSFPLIKQMGIFSELYCLLNIVAPKIGLPTAISAWVGGDYDKQDFLLNACALEVKSYRTSKGEIVQISSKEQLYSTKEYLYLVTYALTQSDDGTNIQHIVEEIELHLKRALDFSTLDLFENKLIECGYSSVLFKEHELTKFIVDRVHIYEVQEIFPKIIPAQVAPEIVSLTYKLDLTNCQQFIIDQEQMIFSNDGVKLS
ncbi:hypothetical protein ACVWXS_005117 [Lysinibacillus sp. TE18511]